MHSVSQRDRKVTRGTKRSKECGTVEYPCRMLRDKWRNLKWVVPIKVTGWKFIHCHIPFNGQEKRYLTLHGDKKIYFTPGNSVQILKDEMYVLSPKQQNVMKQLKEIKERCKWNRIIIGKQ
ncbi:hypothetical protein TNCV_2442291 [Trichonephila clavipes]|nr:hypothetical protein TNCV_2442291 [Trichonephila clavipes]